MKCKVYINICFGYVLTPILKFSHRHNFLKIFPGLPQFKPPKIIQSLLNSFPTKRSLFLKLRVLFNEREGEGLKKIFKVLKCKYPDLITGLMTSCQGFNTSQSTFIILSSDLFIFGLVTRFFIKRGRLLYFPVFSKNYSIL